MLFIITLLCVILLSKSRRFITGFITVVEPDVRSSNPETHNASLSMIIDDTLETISFHFERYSDLNVWTGFGFEYLPYDWFNGHNNTYAIILEYDTDNGVPIVTEWTLGEFSRGTPYKTSTLYIHSDITHNNRRQVQVSRPLEATVTFTLSPTPSPTSSPTTTTASPTLSPTSSPTATTASPTLSPTRNTTSSSTLSPTAATHLKQGSTLYYTVVVIGVIDTTLVFLCLIYIVIKTRAHLRAQRRGNATSIQTIKSIVHNLSHVIGIVLEIFDMSTDYLFAASLIVDVNDWFNSLGWISLGFAVCGLSIFFFKYSAYRTLIAGQAADLRKKLKNECLETDESNEIISEISDREMDIRIISLLNGCCEDVPQTMIVIIVNQNRAWNYISILTITLSMASFILKLSTVIATQCRCYDDAIPQYTPLTLQKTDALTK
eukprot:63029_1